MGVAVRNIWGGTRLGKPNCARVFREQRAPLGSAQLNQGGASPEAKRPPHPAHSQVFVPLLDPGPCLAVLLFLQLLGHLQVILHQAVALHIGRQMMLNCKRAQEQARLIRLRVWEDQDTLLAAPQGGPRSLAGPFRRVEEIIVVSTPFWFRTL